MRVKIGRQELLLATLHRHFMMGKAPKDRAMTAHLGAQAQFANNPQYFLRIRAEDFNPETWNAGLIKAWTMRGTLHAIPQDEFSLYLSARGVPEEWAGWRISSKRMEYWAGYILELIESGVVERDPIRKKCVEKGLDGAELSAVFNGWGGAFYELSRRGLIAHECVTAKRFVRINTPPPIITDMKTARETVARRYFAGFGPASIEDFYYFTGWKHRDTDEILNAVMGELETVECEGKTLYYSGKLDTSGEVPECMFLAGFDQILMGYKNRSRLMDERFKDEVTTNTGIVHPTILLDGRVSARWNKNGAKIVVTPFVRISKKRWALIKRHGQAFFRDEDVKITFADEGD